MNEDILKGKWQQIKGNVKAQWGKLTNDDLDRIAGEKEILVGRVQELYGESRDQVEKSLDNLVRTHSTQNDITGSRTPQTKTEKSKGF